MRSLLKTCSRGKNNFTGKKGGQLKEEPKKKGGNRTVTDIRIYQIDLDRDHDSRAFASYYSLSHWKVSPGVQASLYDMVFEGSVEAKDIEDVYRIFNMEKPEGYKGRSLSVSDVVEIVESEDIKPGFYYCDVIGFKSISFETELNP